MKPTHTVEVSSEIDATPEAVWERVSNHAATHTWVLAASVRLLTPGKSEKNGVGAIREVSFPEKRFWTTIREEIVASDAPRSFSYKIVAGMPGLLDHLGTLTIEPRQGGRSKLTWHVDFVFSRWHPMGWFAGPFTKTFGAVLEAAVREVARQMSSR